MQYFTDRTQAGQLLADKMQHLQTDNCAVLAVSEGGVLVGAEIAKRLHTSLYLLATQDIKLPRESESVATMTSAGTFSYNHDLSSGELDAINADYRTYIDQEKFHTFQELNRIVGKDGAVPKTLLKRHKVIIVTDGLQSDSVLNVIDDFLKPIALQGIVIATPIAHVSAVDKMHLLADEIFCLGVIENYISTEHYYDSNVIPDHQTVVEIMKNIVLNW